MGKVVTKKEFFSIRKELAQKEKKIVLCHGVFDLVHPGHIEHFQEAKELGDVLIVSITAAKYVRKGPGRPYFNDELRLKVLSSITYIDYVLLSESYTVEDIIECVKPNIYVKGKEYENESNDITGKISEETSLIEKYGGTVYFTSGQVFSSTKLINNHMGSLSKEVKDSITNLKKSYTFKEIKEMIEKMESIKILVIGDVIVDNYTFCDVQGLMSKDRGYSVKYREEKVFLGGSAAIARHIAQFSQNVTLASIIGNESNIHSRLLNDLGKDMRIDMVYSESYSTIVKKRFIAINEKREEFDKLFSINHLPNSLSLPEEEMQLFKNKLMESIKEYDMVVLCDFGHGLVNEEVMKIIQEKANYLALNCQTNSANYGMNLITKYKNTNLFTLDQKELRLAFHDPVTSEVELLTQMKELLNATHGFLTQASHGATGIYENITAKCPALTLNVKDTVGAGDAFFSMAALCSFLQLPVEVSVFLGNVAGALAANIIGNERPIDKVDLLKYVSTLMNI